MKQQERWEMKAEDIETRLKLNKNFADEATIRHRPNHCLPIIIIIIVLVVVAVLVVVVLIVIVFIFLPCIFFIQHYTLQYILLLNYNLYILRNPMNILYGYMQGVLLLQIVPFLRGHISITIAVKDMK